MKVQFDFSELNAFAENLKDSYKIETTLMTATQNIARVLHQHLLEQTPVKTGNLRKMWSAGDNLLFTVDRVDGGFQVTLINSARANSKDGFMYGIAVNDGHKTPNGGWVMGRFFVENSIDLTYPKVEQIIMKELEKWWDSV
jgi:hypothetical protein